MVDVAKLAFDVDSRSLKSANDNLGKLSKSADKAERSSKKFGRATKGAATGAKKMSTAVQGTSKSVNFLKTALVSMAAVVLTAFAIAPIFAFADSIAEVSTLVDTTVFDMKRIRTEALKMSKEFGGKPAAQVKAFYQIISAGAETAAEATDILTVSNKLAIGGVTDVGVAVDGLTNILNAYGSEVEGATEVSDALFIGMKAGKTTIGELSASLGKVAPLAVAVGVGFDELVASISALTKGGIKTTEAVTGVRAILAAVAKPTSEASKLAKQLGLEFNAASLKSKGFTTFLADLVKKTKGSTEQLALLFGGVEALIPIMALSGQAGVDFNKIMEQMAGKAGATEEAFTKMAASPGFQAKRVWGSLDAAIITASDSLTNKLSPALKLVADNMDTIFKVGMVIASAMIPAIIAGIFSLGIAIAATPIGVFALIAAGITAAISAVIIFRKELGELLTFVPPGIKFQGGIPAAPGATSTADPKKTSEAESQKILLDLLARADKRDPISIIPKLGDKPIIAVTKAVDDLDEVIVGATTSAIGLFNGFMGLTEAQQEFRATSKDSFQGFFADIRQGISLFGALGNAINRIADKLLDMATSSLFESLFAGGTKGSGLLSLFGGLFAHGGVLGAGKFGIAGEDGPEFIRGPATITPINKIPANNNGGVTIQVDARGATDPAAVEAAVNRGIDRAIPRIVAVTERRAVSRARPGFA